MSNNFFNFKLPDFNEKYGEDWETFKAIIAEQVDYIMRKTWELYHLNDINLMPDKVIECQLDTLNIEYAKTDSPEAKRQKLRAFPSEYANKALTDMDNYLDIAESIVGVRGEIFSGIEKSRKWGLSHWRQGASDSRNFIAWGFGSKFDIFFDVKTADNDLLDEIAARLRAKHIKPAFYIIYLIDTNFKILRTV